MATKRLLILLAIALLTAAAVFAAPKIAPLGGDRPPGVPPEQWHAFSSDLGIYVTPPKIELGRAHLQGRLMAKINGAWLPVELARSATDDGPHFLGGH